MHRSITLLVLAAILAGGCASTAASSSPSSSSAPAGTAVPSEAGTPRPIVIDADMDQSDLTAILVLLRDPTVEVLGIAIDGTGLVHCQGGRQVIGYLLHELGRTDVPYGCGRQNGGDDAHPFPDDWRTIADTGYGLDIRPSVQTEFPPDAVDLIRDAVDSKPGDVTLVTLGPLTNLEDAFAADPTLPDRIAGIHAMLGSIDTLGNVYLDGLSGGRVEWNAYADPSAVQAVFAADVPISIVPLDATDDVPVPADLAERLASDHAAAGADLAYELLLRNPSRLNAAEGQQLWDELAALAVSAPDLVTWTETRVSVGDRGRLTVDPGGRPIRYASAADRPAVEGALLAALRRGGPRATPFELAGRMHATWDGTTCAVTVDGDGPGVYTLEFRGQAGTPSSVLLAGVRDPHPWSELEAFLASVDLTTDTTPPEWVVQVGHVNDEPGTGDSVTTTVEVGPGMAGPICASGTWPDIHFVAGTPFEVVE